MARQPVSIVIPTYHRDRVLRETVGSVLGAMEAGDELIVVDQSRHHDEETAAFLREGAQAGRFRLLTESVANLPRARNVGWRHARSDFILFLDDDVTVPPGFLASHLQHFARDEVAAVAGRIVLPDEDPHAERPLPVSAEQGRRRMDLQVMRYTTPLRNPVHVAGGNMCWRRAWLERIGGFSHRYSGAALGEDVEAAGRLRRAGGNIVYEPGAWLVHHVEAEGGCRAAPGAGFARSRARMRDYYYSIFHGCGVKEGLVQWWSRLTRRANNSSSAGSGAAAAPGESRVVSGLGRIAGCVDGVAQALTERPRRWSDLIDAPPPLRVARPSVAVVIATYNRHRDLCETLESLRAHSPGIDELVIVDQTPSASVELEAALKMFPKNITVHHVRLTIPNASRARNEGVRRARADVILFIDDDVTLVHDLVEAHRKHYSSIDVAAVGGRIAWPGQDIAREHPFPGSARDAARSIDAPVCYATTPFDDALHLITCNFSIRREVFIALGGFHERLSGFGEDLDLVARLRKQGWRARYAPEAVLVHRSAPEGGIRLALNAPFQFGRRRGWGRHYSTLRAVGFAGWVAAVAARTFRGVVKLIGAERSARGNPPINPSPGPVARIRASSRNPASVAVRIVYYKSLELLGSCCSVPSALANWLRFRRHGGDHFKAHHDE